MEVDVLIGADFGFSFMSGRCIKGEDPESPTALESAIGWVLTGPCKKDENPVYTPNMLVTAHALMSSSESKWKTH